MDQSVDAYISGSLVLEDCPNELTAVHNRAEKQWGMALAIEGPSLTNRCNEAWKSLSNLIFVRIQARNDESNTEVTGHPTIQAQRPASYSTHSSSHFNQTMNE